ncbi:GNAT family N-acetyltransferase [Novosphingobium sp.]|uniref:GNAT family N-acetyltransferase n=1 Tax=Novosphingobium sp. TaxID=1874826 RepID=UPI0025D83C18|nr:GNAT family N-acetyltransferase [Novosphingobium sp.]
MSALPAGYEVTCDQSRIDATAAHAYLTRSYWAAGIPVETVLRSIANSICVGAFFKSRQVGFARVVSDRATFAYLADVYVLEPHRGLGLSHALLAAVDKHPELQGLRRWALFTQDAQALYRQHGWTEYPHPERMMVRDDPLVYQ